MFRYTHKCTHTCTVTKKLMCTFTHTKYTYMHINTGMCECTHTHTHTHTYIAGIINLAWQQTNTHKCHAHTLKYTQSRTHTHAQNVKQNKYKFTLVQLVRAPCCSSLSTKSYWHFDTPSKSGVVPLLSDRLKFISGWSSKCSATSHRLFLHATSKGVLPSLSITFRSALDSSNNLTNFKHPI